MLIHVDPALGRLEVRDVQNFVGVAIQVEGRPAPKELAASLRPMARFASGNHAWVDLEALREACGHDDDPSWHEVFSCMVSHASTEGLVDDTRSLMRATIEYGQPLRSAGQAHTDTASP